MARTAALSLLASALVATAWLRLEVGASDPRAVWLLVLAVAPALVRPWWGRMLATVVALALAARVALGVSPLDARPFDGDHDFFGPLWERFERGALNFYEVVQPFAAPAHPAMHDVLLVAIFAFCLVIAHAIAARRPLLAGVALLGGSLWPATLVAGSDLARGAVTLAAVLLLLATARDQPARNLRPAVVAAVALVAAAVGASTSPAVAKEEFLAWKTWDPYDAPADPVGVNYVWDANYGGVDFPEKATVVLEVTAPRESPYWRATSLDRFAGDRWVEDLAFQASGDGRSSLLDDPLLPRSAVDQTRWLRADVRVEALRGRHLVGGSMPVQVDTGDAGEVSYYTGNVAIANTPLERDDDYTVWSFVPHPTPSQLAAATFGTRSWPELGRYLEVAPGRPTPLFGTPRRGDAVRALLLDPELAPYAPLYRRARETVGGLPNQYAAVVALEAWFRTESGFTYDEQPEQSRDVPPLVEFVTRTQAGYCQHFAGAMTLMLRYLGIPARVGAGFTRGAYDKDEGRWTVTDLDAHTWVEVWFPGYGWLPFDPTPARGVLSGAYTSASSGFNGPEAARTFGTIGAGIFAGRFAEQYRAKLERGNSGFSGRDAPGDYGSGVPLVDRRPGASLLRLLALVAAAALAGLALVKLAVRRSRYVTRDPRRLAGACRRELVDFLADQGMSVPRSATLAEAGALVSHRLAVDARPFVRAATRARFSPPEHADAAAREARRELRRLLRGVRGRIGMRRRLRGAVSLRSLTA